MSHISKLGLENFRVFRDYTEINFAPVTILTGANNSGKSSVIKSLHLLKDNLVANNFSATSALMKGKLNFLSERHKLGQFGLTLNDARKPLSITIPTRMRGVEDALLLTMKFENDNSNDLGNARLTEISLNAQSRPSPVFRFWFIDEEGHFFVDYNYFLLSIQNLIDYANLSPLDSLNLSIDKNTISHSVGDGEESTNNSNSGKLLFSTSPVLKFNTNNEEFKSIRSSEASSDEAGILSGLNFVFFLISRGIVTRNEFRFEKDQKDSLFYSLKNHYNYDSGFLNELVNEFNLKIVKDLYIKTDQLLISKKEVLDYEEIIEKIIKGFFSFELAEYFKIEFLYENAGFGHFYSDEEQDLDDEASSNFRWEIADVEDYYSERDKIIFLLENFLAEGLSEVLSNAADCVKKLHSLDAVRSTTQRLYTVKSQGTDFNEQLHLFLDGKLNHNEKAMSFINKWLEEFGFHGGLTFDISNQGTGIILKVNNRSIADYGYGLTQLLPILLNIVNIMESPPERESYRDLFIRVFHNTEINNTPGSILIIEEPESNLHPRFQSLLADLFIDANKQFNIQFVLETHSEYLIRKLQYLTAKGEILPADTAIYYFHNPDSIPKGKKQVKKITILENGRLSDDFGPGFLDEAANLFEMTLKASFN